MPRGWYGPVPCPPPESEEDALWEEAGRRAEKNVRLARPVELHGDEGMSEVDVSALALPDRPPHDAPIWRLLVHLAWLEVRRFFGRFRRAR